VRVDLKDPDLFERNAFWPVMAWLRENDPVHWHDEVDGPGFWAVTRHRDVVTVFGDDDLFSSRFGMRLDSRPEAVEAVSQQMLIVTDPPEHTRLRQVVGRGFGRSAMPRIERVVLRVVHDVVAEAVRAEKVDLVDIAAQIPNQVVCELMGIPLEHADWLGRVTTEAFDAAEEDDRVGAYSEIFLLFTELLMERREQPGDDFISQIATAQRATEEKGVVRPLTDEEVVFNCIGVLAGANETTRYSMAGAVLELAQDPALWEWLRAAGDAALDPAVEEVLRWTCPGVHGMRTATRDTELGGAKIKAGDRVTVWNVSANRDESVFEEPDRFRLDRTQNRHVTFGSGRHFCIGARVARLELRAFLAELVAGVERIELTGEPRYNSSNFTWGLRTLPVHLVPTRVPVSARQSEGVS